MCPVPNLDGSVRITSDARSANKALKRMKHIITTTENLVVRLNGAKFFSKVYLRSEYNQIKFNKSVKILYTNWNISISTVKYGSKSIK
jgi:hypothetical protein